MSDPKATVPGLRKWLRAVPQPTRIKCDDTLVKVGSSNNRWHDAEQSIVALSPAILQALDNEGTVLRVFRLRDDSGEAVEQVTQKEEWPATPEAQMAQIITAACDRAASRHENAYKMAFDRLSQMYEAQTARLEEALARAARAEAAVLKLKQPQVQYVEAETDEPSAAEHLLGQVLGGAVASLASGSNGAKQ